MCQSGRLANRMAKRKEVSVRVLRRLIDYNPDTGEMRWKERPVWMFSDNGTQGRAGSAKAWNTKWAGRRALNVSSNTGYRVGRVFKRDYLAHRVAWAHYHGHWPEQKIDHKNGRRTDNRITNLRSVDDFGNAQNMGLSKANKSGVTGVYWCRQKQKWHAILHTRGRTRHFGFHTRFEDAVAARKDAERKYGFHPNHGRPK